jgi:hypothetical protein
MPRFGASGTATRALLHALKLQLPLGPGKHLMEIHRHSCLNILAANGTVLYPPTNVSEEGVKQVAKTPEYIKALKVTSTIAAVCRANASMSVPVVLGARLSVTENVVGLVYLLELLLGIRAPVAIRMILKSLLPIGLPDLLFRGVSWNT